MLRNIQARYLMMKPAHRDTIGYFQTFIMRFNEHTNKHDEKPE